MYISGDMRKPGHEINFEWNEAIQITVKSYVFGSEL